MYKENILLLSSFLVLSGFSTLSNANICKQLLKSEIILIKLENRNSTESSISRSIESARKNLKNKLGKAASLSEELLLSHPEYFEVQLLFAEVQKRLHRYERSASLLKPLIEYDPLNYSVSKLAAEVLIVLGQPLTAFKFVNIALNAEPEDDELQYMKIEILTYKGDLNQAEAIASEISSSRIRSYYKALIFMNKDRAGVFAAQRILDSFWNETSSVLWRKAEAQYRLAYYKEAVKTAALIVKESGAGSGRLEKTHALALLLKIHDKTEDSELLRILGSLSQGYDRDRIQKLSVLEEREFWWFRPLNSEIAQFKTSTMVFRN